ncbi:MAG: methionine--tRNA ligase [Chlamydiae bacterium]|nr:methionine--tRNA ligase [Chlamydiota bacterium]
MQEKVLITAALPYANGPLHFGHIAGAYLPGDCYARYQRLKGSDVLYICGSDEYGVAITLSADMAGRTPKEHVDIFHKINKDFFDKLNISFDHYSRTTWEGHVQVVQEFFLDLLNNGYIEKKETLQLYSEAENRFLADRYVVGVCPKCGFDKARGDECQSCGASYEATDLIDPKSKLTSSKLVKKATTHWFLRFDKFKEELASWIEKKQWKPNVINFAKAYIDDLKPRAITRDSEWGVPVPLPEAEGKVLYVWFDAPIGYISATKHWAQQAGNPDSWKSYWEDPSTRLVQFIGKDNIPFHAVFFPAMTMGQNKPLKLVDDLPANEFYNLEGRQFSKSDGWYIDLETFFNKYTTDQIRYAIASNAPESQDSEFTWKDFQMRCNAELLGKYGNLVNRVLVFAQQQCSGVIPKPEKLEQVDLDFLSKISEIAKEAALAYESYHLRKASQLVMELAQAGNAYFDCKKPWIAAKAEEKRPEMLSTIFCCLEAIKTLALISSPILPSSSEKIWKLLGFQDVLASHSWSDVLTNRIQSGIILPKPEILFTKIEDEQVQKEEDGMKALAESAKKNAEPSYLPLKPEVSFDDVKKIDLRVAKILHVERVPKSKKLLKLSVDLGFEKRTIVAGIGEKMEDISALVGKKILVVANLKPALLMGVESQGMVLAGLHDAQFELADFVLSPVGTNVS